MTFSKFNDHTNSIFSDLKVLKIEDVITMITIITIIMITLSIMNDSFQEHIPDDVKTLFEFNNIIYNIIYSYETHFRDLYHIPKVNTSKSGINSLRYDGRKLGNQLGLGLGVGVGLRK